MASPLPTGKQSVNLATQGARVSKIRRDPPPPQKELVLRDPAERDRVAVVVGVLSFALAIVVIIVAFGSYSGFNPREIVIDVKDAPRGGG
ncbi:hypothetical protein [Sphingomonas xanthus]|uniref:Uncharacterized protein n=1 Tax=Sphingomonas xanthus TaxID=2594473 RepID=A0A516IQY9_9SPHN|nr:hypothetical protein [Sphingomonas xanthus]QDP19302.1 hypothetical protein FMM02_04575 [Sphingomonas xanthus]